MTAIAVVAKQRSQVEILLEMHLSELFEHVAAEYVFHHERKWRFDFAVIAERIGVEIEGGLNVHGRRDGNGERFQGRHTRGRGYQGDLDKYNAATESGWRVFRFSVQDVLEGKGRASLQRYVNWRRVNSWRGE